MAQSEWNTQRNDWTSFARCKFHFSLSFFLSSHGEISVMYFQSIFYPLSLSCSLSLLIPFWEIFLSLFLATFGRRMFAHNSTRNCEFTSSCVNYFYVSFSTSTALFFLLLACATCHC